MTRRTGLRILTLVLGMGVLIALIPVSAQSGPHAYFNALVARPDHWKSYHFRSAAQLDRRSQGGYAHSNSAPLWVTYNPGADLDPNRQDAAKVVIPAFVNSATLAAPVAPSDTFITLTEFSGSMWSQHRAVRIGGEIMKVNRPSGTVITGNRLPVVRAQYGTTAQSHAAGAPVAGSNNSLLNQVRVPLGTSDGNVYLFTWDGYWTNSYVQSGLGNHKAFQFSSRGDRIWLEPQTRFDGGARAGRPANFDPNRDVAGVEMRSYNALGGGADYAATDGRKLGPGVTNREPINPKVGQFVIKPNTWTRFWVRIEQRANDYDYMDYWVADEHVGPVQIYSQIPLSVQAATGEPSRIDSFWLEFNTSTTEHERGNFRDLVSYVRNFVALVNPPRDVTPLLLRPSPNAGLPPLAALGPRPPGNVRVAP